MEATVRAFNNLSRPEKLPIGEVSNHWVFGVCHLDLQPAVDIVLAVNAQALITHQSRLAQVLSLPTTRERAGATIPLLLDAFANPDPESFGPEGPGKLFAPWTWSTVDPDMAQAIEDGLKKHGVKPELCKVSVCTAEERIILESGREFFYGQLATTGLFQFKRTTPVAPGDPGRCHGCNMSCDSFFVPLKKCARCEMAFYHSRECQKKGWKKHKAVCHAPGAAPTAATGAAPSAAPRAAPRAAPGLSPYDYFNKKATADPEAIALLNSLHISPGGGTAPALHKLVYTGKDTPENLRLLYGPKWEKAMKEEHAHARLECLLDPPPGSPSFVLNNRYSLDSALDKSVRPATEAEQKQVKEIREIQAKIVQKVGAGREPTADTMGDVLLSLGPTWMQKMQVYSLAANTLDQGVPITGYVYS